MNDQNIDVNLIIQSFQERINQLITEIVVKEATIKQLTIQLSQVQQSSDGFETPAINKKEK